MNIDTIENGYVIDHITAGNAIKIYRMLDLEELDCQVALITNAKSQKTGIKDMLKIGSLIDINLDKIAFINPDVTINIVKNEKIIEKKKLDFDVIEKILCEQKGNQHDRIFFNKEKIESVLPPELLKRDKRYIEQYIIEALERYKKIKK